jgi:hypothetical protein
MLVVWPCFLSTIVWFWIFFHLSLQALQAKPFYAHLLHRIFLQSRDRSLSATFRAFIELFVLTIHKHSIFQLLKILLPVFQNQLFLRQPRPKLFFFVDLQGLSFELQVLLIWSISIFFQLRLEFHTLFASRTCICVPWQANPQLAAVQHF